MRVSEDKKCSFFRILGMLCFLETPVLRFALLPYYRRDSLWDFYLWSPENNDLLKLNQMIVNPKMFQAIFISEERNVYKLKAWNK